MVGRLSRKKRKAQERQRQLDERLTATIQDVYRQYQLLKKLEESAYEVSEELYMLRKREGAKYLYLMKVARARNLTGDVAAPKKAKTHLLKKRGYQKDKLFTDETSV